MITHSYNVMIDNFVSKLTMTYFLDKTFWKHTQNNSVQYENTSFQKPYLKGKSFFIHPFMKSRLSSWSIKQLQIIIVNYNIYEGPLSLVTWSHATLVPCPPPGLSRYQ